MSAPSPRSMSETNARHWGSSSFWRVTTISNWPRMAGVRLQGCPTIRRPTSLIPHPVGGGECAVVRAPAKVGEDNEEHDETAEVAGRAPLERASFRSPPPMRCWPGAWPWGSSPHAAVGPDLNQASDGGQPDFLMPRTRRPRKDRKGGRGESLPSSRSFFASLAIFALKIRFEPPPRHGERRGRQAGRSGPSAFSVPPSLRGALFRGDCPEPGRFGRAFCYQRVEVNALHLKQTQILIRRP